MNLPTLFLNDDTEHNFIDKLISEDIVCDNPGCLEIHYLAAYIANGRNPHLYESAHEYLSTVEDFIHFHEMIAKFSYDIELRDAAEAKEIN